MADAPHRPWRRTQKAVHSLISLEKLETGLVIDYVCNDCAKLPFVSGRNHLKTQNTELEVFVDKTVRLLAGVHADGEGKHARRRNKKARDFTHPFIQ